MKDKLRQIAASIGRQFKKNFSSTAKREKKKAALREEIKGLEAGIKFRTEFRNSLEKSQGTEELFQDAFREIITKAKES